MSDVRVTKPPTSLPPEYYEAARKLGAAAADWQRQHPFAEPRFSLEPFELEMKRRANLPADANVMIGCGLDEAIDKIAVNEDARAMLRALDAATGHQATYFQFKCVYLAAIEAQVERGQGRLADAGDWRCPCCSTLIDGYTRTDGKAGAPEAGMHSVCAYCNALSRVNAAANGFEAVSDQELRALPKDFQKHVAGMREQLQRMREQKARRS